MITKLRLHKVATYQPDAVEMEPTAINYMYGGNGSGKTTLSNVIANQSAYSDCRLTWQTNPIETQVYNKPFVESHFSQNIKGIFTLGKDAIEAKAFIEKAKAEIETHQSELVRLNSSLNKKKTEKGALTEKILEKCWDVKDKYQEYFREAYTGFIGSKKSFFEKCQQEQSNSSTLLSSDEIQTKCHRIFSKILKTYDPIRQLILPDIAALESDLILKTKIIAKEDVPMGTLIARLDNSDWISQGLGYLEQIDNQCPFCQQTVADDLKNKIEAVFDETYDKQIKELQAFREKYKSDISSIISSLGQITEKEIEILDYSELQDHIRLLNEKYSNNLATIDKKLASPSIEIQLKPLLADFEKAQEYVDTYRKQVDENNITAKNIDKEKKKLKSEIWRFIVNELSSDFIKNNKEYSEIQTGKKNIENQIDQRTSKITELNQQIKAKEADVTSIAHTKNEINKILNSFGFTNFSISIEEAGDEYYKIIRQNGQDAKETLSEGEYTFITFLYFYQLLKGNTNESGLTTDKVVVIDDPISSLDSNVLFIVSNLIKKVLKDCRNGKNGIKQVFILTHNIHFHKEVTFKGNREGLWKEESYWIVRNLSNQSNIFKYEENPIQTTYGLLWREIKDKEQINKATIFNTLRRILEYYFKIIGGMDYEKIVDQFDGEDKIIFRSLFSWINDGSHFINDDLVVYSEAENIEKQLEVFKEIFYKMGHNAHYNMMMGEESA
jgi:wobble nucleotide-excising tRNase